MGNGGWLYTAADIWTFGIVPNFVYFAFVEWKKIRHFSDGAIAVISWAVLALIWPLYWLIFYPLARLNSKF